MYNVRLIEYPTGIQVRVYDTVINGVLEDVYKNVEWVDFVNGDVKYKNQVPYDVWLDGSQVDWELLDSEQKEKKGESLRVSMTRTKNMIYYLARSNVWDWFVTLTISPDAKIDRYNFKDCSDKVRKWFDNLRQRKALDMFYLIVPERHKDGAYHFHALMGGCDGLDFKDSGRRTKDGQTVYNLANWKYGFSTATAVTDTSRVSSYISKYITKDLCAVTMGKRRYWASNNCQRASVEDYLVIGDDLKQYVRQLYDNMTWKKRVNNAYFSVDYFEIPKHKSNKTDSI